MSLYNMLFGVNEKADMLLSLLGYTKNDIPRFRDCMLVDGMICIHTRTGGGNREEYEGDNAALAEHPLYISDSDDDFDCTYANFFYRYPEEYRADLEAMASNDPDYKPSEMWKIAFDSLKGNG